MKPLAMPGSIGTGETPTKRLHVVGLLKPDGSGDEGKGWVVVVAAKEKSPGKEHVKRGITKDSVDELNFSTDERLKLFRRIPSKTPATNQADLNMGQFMLYDHVSGKSLKIRSTSDSSDFVEFFSVTISKSEQMDLMENQKCKLVGTDELGDHHVFLVPMDSLGNVTSGPVRRGVGTTAERILMRLERRLLTSEHFPLIFSRKQWKSLMGCVATWQERLWAKNKDGRGILRWIKRRAGSGDAGKRRRGARVDTEFETEEEEEEAPLEDDSEKRKLVRKALIKKKKQQKKGKGDNGKVNRINFAGDKKTMRGEEDYADEEGDKDKQLIKIELKPDPLIQDSSFQFCSGDLLRLKVTMFEDLRSTKRANYQNYEYDTYEMEIDFVENFMCEANNTLDKCRSRRITKLLERAMVQDLKWEKGVHISGQQFAVCWIPYRIPVLSHDNGDTFPVGCLDSSKFKVAGNQHEMRIRLYGTDRENISRFVLSASTFPLNIMPMEAANNTTAAAEGRNASWVGNGGDILQVFHEVLGEEEAEVNEDQEVSVDYMITKSLSATEFDV